MGFGRALAADQSNRHNAVTDSQPRVMSARPHRWVPAAITAQYATKGMKGPHKNVDNPAPKDPHSILE